MKNRTHQKRPRWRLSTQILGDSRVVEWRATVAGGHGLVVEPGHAGAFVWRALGCSGVARSRPPLARRLALEAVWGIAENEGWLRRKRRSRRGSRRRRGA